MSNGRRPREACDDGPEARSGSPRQPAPCSPPPGRAVENEFAAQLDAAVIRFEREHRFAPPRKFRFDFVLLPLCLKLAVEIDGQVHRIEGQWRSDREKGNLALAAGWRVFHFARDQVRSGEAVRTIRAALQQPAMIGCTSLLLTR